MLGHTAEHLVDVLMRVSYHEEIQLDLHVNTTFLQFIPDIILQFTLYLTENACLHKIGQKSHYILVLVLSCSVIQLKV